MSKSEKKSQIVFQEVPRDFRTEIPNIVFELLNAGEISANDFLLYATYRRIAGPQGACWVGTRGLAEKTQLSTPSITRSKLNLSRNFAALNGKSLIAITPCDRKNQVADTIVIVDIWQDNHNFFKESLTCVKKRHTGVQNDDTRVCKKPLQKKKPYKKEPYKNPPPPPPPKSVTPDPVSLRSEDEDSFYEVLNLEPLTPAEKRRLSREFTEDQVIRALKISLMNRTKVNTMGKLLHILNNPDRWTEAPELEQLTPNQQLALQYNQKLVRLGPESARKNEISIRKDNVIRIISFGKGTT